MFNTLMAHRECKFHVGKPNPNPMTLDPDHIGSL